MGGNLQWLSGVRLAVVDDSEINREIAMELLRTQGATCLEFHSGEAVVRWLEGREHEVDAVLMDVQMPVMDGLQATRQIRLRARALNLPIVALTAGALQSERDAALAAGMNGFLTKPLELVEVVRTLRLLIARSRGQRVDVAIARTDGAIALAEPATRWPVLEGIDTAAARSHASGSLSLFTRMLHLMQEQYGDWSTRWAQRLQQPGERPAFVASLHKLRGGAAVLGALRLAEVAGRAEATLLQDPASDPVSALQQVSAALAPVLAAIAAWSASNAAAAAEARQSQGIDLDVVQRLQELLTLLQAQDMDAFDALAVRRGDLLCLWTVQEVEAFESSVNALRFAEAAHRLENTLATASPAAPFPV